MMFWDVVHFLLENTYLKACARLWKTIVLCILAKLVILIFVVSFENLLIKQNKSEDGVIDNLLKIVYLVLIKKFSYFGVL